MTAPLDDQILNLLETKAAAISIAGGYQTDMAADRVHRPAVGELEFSSDELEEGPQITIRRGSRATRLHLRGAEEFVLKVDIRVTAATEEEASALMGDLVKLIAANQLWNNGSSNLAAKTWIEENDLQDFDVDAAEAVGQMTVCIKGYADVTDPTSAKAI